MREERELQVDEDEASEDRNRRPDDEDRCRDKGGTDYHQHAADHAREEREGIPHNLEQVLAIPRQPRAEVTE